jgi:hypothetical protein
MRRAIGLSLAVAMLAGISGCGGDDSQNNALNPTIETQPVEKPATDTSTAPQGVTDPTGTAPLTDSGIHPQAGGVVQFSTPTKNIGCVIADNELRCDTAKHSWAPPPKPASCKFDWGDAIGIQGSQPAGFLCVSDTTLGVDPTLGYDSFVEDGDFRCESRVAGLTCTNTATDNGFFLSRQEYRFLGQ